MNIKKIAPFYFGIGIAYGLGRSWYWLQRVEDRSWSYSAEKDRYVEMYHPPTTAYKLGLTAGCTAMSQAFWPLFALCDLSVYEKYKMGIRELNAPFPFEQLRRREP